MMDNWIATWQPDIPGPGISYFLCYPHHFFRLPNEISAPPPRVPTHRHNFVLASWIHIYSLTWSLAVTPGLIWFTAELRQLLRQLPLLIISTGNFRNQIRLRHGSTPTVLQVDTVKARTEHSCHNLISAPYRTIGQMAAPAPRWGNGNGQLGLTNGRGSSPRPSDPPNRDTTIICDSDQVDRPSSASPDG
ncbi:hypothetical protein J6590_033842 [Homalodisca vitripennis]|nr:hypothetical protein J6590_033842 [Homalodisca vitripennis]